jgi:hypothetical protein
MELNLKPPQAQAEVFEVAKNSNFLETCKRRYKLTYPDLVALGFLGCGAVYAAATEPFICCLFLLAIGVFFACEKIMQFLPLLEKRSGLKVRLWQGLLIVVVTIALLSAVELPSHALFLKGLEEFITTTVASSAGDVDPSVVALIFNAIRAIFLILAAVVALYAYNQSQQGNDWRPIAGTVGMGFGIIFAIDVITFAFVGDGSGTGG